MTSPIGIQGGLQLAVVAWKTLQVARAPRDVSLRIVTISLACGSGAYISNRFADSVGPSPSMPLFLLGHNALLVGSVFALNCFFWFSVLDSATAARHIKRGVWPLAVVLIILVIATAHIPPGARNTDSSTLSIPAVAIVNLTTDSYLIGSLITAAVWAQRCAREARPTLKRALKFATVGLVATAVGGTLLIPAQIVCWLGRPGPTALAALGGFVTLTGTFIFLASVSYPGAVMRATAIRIWWEHWRIYRRLLPLWAPLHEAFPQDMLSARVPAPRWRDSLNPRGVHRRYYRRAIEIRDGLVRLSPYISVYGIDAAIESDRALLVRRALDDVSSGRRCASLPISVAPSSQPGLEADVGELVRLAAAFDRIDNQNRRMRIDD